LVPFLDVAGLVEDPDGMPTGVFGPHDVLQPIAQLILVPLELAEELLQGPWGHSGLEGDRLDTLVRRLDNCPSTYVGRWQRVSLRRKQSSNWLRNLRNLGLSCRSCWVSMVDRKYSVNPYLIEHNLININQLWRRSISALWMMVRRNRKEINELRLESTG